MHEGTIPVLMILWIKIGGWVDPQTMARMQDSVDLQMFGNSIFTVGPAGASPA